MVSKDFLPPLDSPKQLIFLFKSSACIVALHNTVTTSDKTKKVKFRLTVSFLQDF